MAKAKAVARKIVAAAVVRQIQPRISGWAWIA
jgi:hypothetical protein